MSNREYMKYNLDSKPVYDEEGNNDSDVIASKLMTRQFNAFHYNTMLS